MNPKDITLYSAETINKMPLDVLAVMGRTAGLHDSMGNTEFGDRVREARAAVAELHLAARDYNWVTENAYGIEQTAPAKARLDAALAKFGGAA